LDEDKILIMMTSGPDTPRRCATPFFMATLAAAMDYDVTMFFTIDGTLLLKKGIAATIFPKAGGKSVESYLNEALETGVKMTACSASTELHGLTPEDLIPEVKMVGGASFWQMSDGAKTVVSF
jgi:predicted peroxiredoxin